MNYLDYNILTAFTISLLFLILSMLHVRRKAPDVLRDLESNFPDFPEPAIAAPVVSAVPEEAELKNAGFLTLEEQQKFRKWQRVFIVSLTAAALCLRGVFGFHSPGGLFPTFGAVLALSYLTSRYYLASRSRSFKKLIQFHLPIVMERLVMAVESGLDIIPAVGAILDLEEAKADRLSKTETDPVTKLLGIVYKLSQSGLSFEKALSEVADCSDSNALRHAFVHLGLAQVEGGEVIAPLRELSDATQLYYQESIELEIAKLPATATMPLVLTFAGLIVFFISTPLVQMTNITQAALPENGGVHAGP